MTSQKLEIRRLHQLQKQRERLEEEARVLEEEVKALVRTSLNTCHSTPNVETLFRRSSSWMADQVPQDHHHSFLLLHPTPSVFLRSQLHLPLYPHRGDWVHSPISAEGQRAHLHHSSLPLCSIVGLRCWRPSGHLYLLGLQRDGIRFEGRGSLRIGSSDRHFNTSNKPEHP